MASREKGYGLTAELTAKKDGKFDLQLTRDAIDWVYTVIGENAPVITSQNDVHVALKDGVVLCKLANVIKPQPAIKISPAKMAFKMMENIGKFLEFCTSVSLIQTDLFQTVDLYEGQNIPQVICTILALGRKANSINSRVPSLGPKESQKNKREFSEEQLKSGDGIIGLQAGTNRGANQAGMSFGKTRQIM